MGTTALSQAFPVTRGDRGSIDVGIDPMGGTSEASGAPIALEMSRWGGVIKEFDLQAQEALVRLSR